MSALLSVASRCTLASAIVMALAQAANAQQASEPATLDTIIVTSQGRSEELQKAAAPIAVFSEVRIQDAGIETTPDFVRLVPNMQFDQSDTAGNSFVSMRGIQQVNNADAPVAIVVDGVPQNHQREFRMELFDIEQIEVLRGPQGALYGRNAVAGAVVIKTKQPGNRAEGYAQASIGGYGHQKLSASASGPVLEDRLFYRLSVSGHDFDGALNNAYRGDKADWLNGYDLRGQLRWLPSERHEIEWRINHSFLHGSAMRAVSMTSGNPNNTNTWQEPLSDLFSQSTQRTKSSNLHYRWRGDQMTLTSITGYTHIFEDLYADLDYCNPVLCPGGFAGLGQVDQAWTLNLYQLSQELRLSSPEHSSLQWTTGVYWLGNRRKYHIVANALDLSPPLPLVVNNESNRNRAWAVFGQVQFPLGASDRLELSLRLDRDRRRQSDPDSGQLVQEGSWSAWQPKLTWSHDLDDTQMLYITSGRGFRSGGFNGVNDPAFKPENLTSYEIGYKSSWLDHQVTFNSAVFYEYDKDYQFFYVDVPSGGTQVIANLSRVELYGLESEINWRVEPGWEVFASLGLLGSGIRKVGQLNTDLPITKGRRVPRSQPYNAVIGSQWNFPLGAYRAMFRFDVERNGKRTWEADNFQIMDEVTLVNARFTFFGHARWNLTAWGTNLFNHRYYNDFISTDFTGLGRDIAFHAPGRRYGLDLRYDF